MPVKRNCIYLHTMKKTSYLTIFCFLLLSAGLKAQDLPLYSFWAPEQGNLGFVSLSDNYPLSSHPDSLAIPDIKARGIESAGYFKLGPVYRKRFLAGTKIKESDRVFVYDYGTNKLVSFLVRNLNVMARLNFYAGKEDWPYAQEDYMFGFEINKDLLKGFGAYFNKVFVCVGKENPFAAEKLKPMIWRKIKGAEYPSKAIKKDLFLQKKYEVGNAYLYDTRDYQYFMQDYLYNNQTVARRLIVLRLKDRKTIYQKVFSESEGTSLAPLNFVNNDPDGAVNQWAGKLFKNKATVIFGFEYESFGCPGITILGQPVKEVYINCDNRH